MYYNELKSKGLIYSLDMVRLNIVIRSQYFEDFKDLISKFGLTSGVNSNYYLNHKSLGYRHLWKFTIESSNGSGVFVVGLGLNNKKENQSKGFIEFNPNKLMNLGKFISFYDNLVSCCCDVTLIRYDIAIDIPVDRCNIRMIRNGKSKYEYLYSRYGLTIGSVTEYQGIRNTNKFTKLYDKTKESHLDYCLSRIEFTFERKEEEFKGLPEFYVYSNDYCNYDLDFSKLSKSQLVMVDLLRNSQDVNFYLNMLEYRIKEKIKPYLSDFKLFIDKEYLLRIREQAINFENIIDLH